MTPDNFFKINPDIQPGTKKTLEGEAKEFLPKKPEGQPEGNTDFSKILDNPDNERAKTSAGTKEALQPGSTLTAKQANAEDSLLSTTEPRVAERTGQ
ncbi:MAG: hypothetical protein KDK72_10435, partial [Chlamydiia bacterium]|nr:hypothetical protein [Chlamydiia bacterium]